MSTSPDGRRSNFTQTCNLLSQFLKDNRTSALGISGKLESRATTMDLLTNLQNSDDASTPQLTILYGGKVFVFDAFPPEKATEVMELATKLASDHSVKVPQSNTAQQAPPPPPQAFGSDMRYPRRASLLKFLEKRKERVNARRPYQMNNPQHEGSSSGGDSEYQSSKRFDLNL